MTSRHLRLAAASVFASSALLGTHAATAQTLQPPFDSVYSVRDLGSVPGVPSPYGGITFKYDDPDVLLIGGSANSTTGAIYAIRVTRGSSGEITGFQGTATVHAQAPNNDGGLQYGPNNVLFYARYNRTEIGQIKVGSSSPDKVIALTSVTGWSGASPGALSFVPPGYPGAGQFKVCSYSGGSFHRCDVSPDGNGTFDLVNMTGVLALPGGPEGLLYPPPGSPLIADYQTIMISEYSAAAISIYDVDGQGDPVAGTRRAFMTGVGGAEGSTIDASSGGFLFSTFGGGNRVLVVDGFGSCGTFTAYGSGIPNAQGGTPAIRGTGCASFNRAINFQVGNGPANAIGAFNVGFTRINVPLFGGFVLNTPDIPIAHGLDANGEWTTTLNTPNDPSLVGNSIFFQAAYFDATAPFGVTASYGLDMLVR